VGSPPQLRMTKMAPENATMPPMKLQSFMALEVCSIRTFLFCAPSYRVARAAFDEAVKHRPGRIVTLRQKTRLLADSRQKNRG
jgi:hypothetical protein